MRKEHIALMQSLDQAQTPEELHKAVDSVIARLTVNADALGNTENDDEIDNDDAPTGALSPRAQNNNLSPMVPATAIKGLLIEIVLMKRRLNALTATLKAVQGYVDGDISTFIAATTGWIKTANDALRATTLYNSDWFSTLPYSMAAKLEIAQQLINICTEFKITNDYWDNLVNYNEAAMDFADYKPQS